MLSSQLLSTLHYFGVFGLSLLSACLILNVFVALLLLGAKNQRFVFLSAQKRLVLLHILGFAPLIIAGLSTALVAVLAAHPNWQQPYLHWHHTPGQLDWHSYSGLIAFIFTVVYLSIRYFVWIKAQQQLRTEPKNQLPLAYSYGFLPAKSYISSDLIERLNPAELNVVRQHEHSHCLQNDPIKLFLFFSLCQCFYFFLRQPLLWHYHTAMEERADLNTAAAGHDAFLIADTLLKVTRLQNQLNLSHTTSCAFSGSSLERRVHALTQESPQGFSCFRVILFALCFICFSLVLSIDSIHHLSESLLFQLFN